MRSVVVAMLVAGCGRLAFDPLGVTGDDASISKDAPTDVSDSSDGGGPSDTSSQSGMPVQMGSAVSITGGGAVPLPGASTAGTLLVLTLATNVTSNLVTPPGFTVIGPVGTNGSCYALLAYEENNPGGITSVTIGNLAGVPSIAQLTEWNTLTTGAFDASGTATGGIATAQTVQTSSPTSIAGELGVTVFCEDTNMPAYTPGAGWTNLGSFQNVSSSPSFTSDYHANVAGTVAETQTSSVAAKYSAVIATFRVP